MTSKKAEKELAARQAELSTLEKERDQLAIELGDLNNQRNAAIRALARGGGSPERKTIMALERQMGLLVLKLEELGRLVAEAQTAVNEAEAALEAADIDGKIYNVG